MIKKDEGFVGANSETMKSSHPKTNTDYGAYYDTRGYLTTGYGSLISKNPKGSKEEAADIQKWVKMNQYDPFTLTEDQANEILPKDIDRVTAKARAQLGDVLFEDLPEQAQQAVVSLAYNTGTLGPKTAEQIRKAAKTSSTSEWKKAAKMFENWHGSKTNEQERGVLLRRKREASLLESIEGLTLEGSDSEQTLETDNEVYDGETWDGQRSIPSPLEEPETQELTDVQNETMETGVQTSSEFSVEGTEENYTPQPATFNTDNVEAYDYTESRGRITGQSRSIASEQTQKTLAPPAPTADSEMAPRVFSDPDSRYAQFQAERRRLLQEEIVAENTNVLDRALLGAGAFGNHITNSFMTENIVGSTVRKGIVELTSDHKYDMGFDPTKMLDYKDLIMDVPPEKLKEYLEAPNAQVFRSRVLGYKMETQAREEMNQYFNENPISGFVGIGMASALDVTSFIPVNGIARFAGLNKMMRGIPATARAIGAGIAENVVQDLIQETVLIQNSETRKWEDGDVFYGMVGSIVMGGVAGKFKAQALDTKFTKLAQKYNLEKNLAGTEMLIRQAQSKGLGQDIIQNLNKTKMFLEQEITKTQRTMISNALAEQQVKITNGILDTEKINIVKKQMEFNEFIDKEIELEKAKPNVVQQAINDVKMKEKQVRNSFKEPMESLRKQITDTSKKLKQFKEAGTEGVERQRQIKRMELELNDLNTKLKQKSDELYQATKPFKGMKDKAVKAAKKMEDPRDIKISKLESEKKAYQAMLKGEYDLVKTDLEMGNHPALNQLRTLNNFNEIAESLGLPIKFNTVDEMDKFLGLEFEDSAHKSAGAAAYKQPDFLMKNADVDRYFNRIDGEVWGVIARNSSEALNNPALGLSAHQVLKDSKYAQLLRATKLNEYLTTDSTIGQFVLNKSALRTSDNELIRGFYNLLAPDGVGRIKEGKLSLVEQSQQINNIYLGKLLTSFNDNLPKINELALVNPALRNKLELNENPMIARLQTMEAYYPEKVSELLRDELLESGSTRALYGNDVGDIVEKMANDFDNVSNGILNRAKQAEVKNTEEILQGSNTRGWFHRTWDNVAVRNFVARNGENKLIELVNNSMIRYLSENGVELTDDALDITLQGGRVNPKTGTIRLYHGGVDSASRNLDKVWLTNTIQDAESWAQKSGGEVFFVDINPNHPRFMDIKGDLDNGIAPLSRIELGKDVASRLKKVTDKKGVSLGEIKTQAKKFAFGIFNADLQVNKQSKISTAEFLESLINKGLGDDVSEALEKELKAVTDKAAAAKNKELGKRKPLDLNGEVVLDDGSVFQMKDLLEKNILYSQKNYIQSMSSRIAAAENGIKDIDELDKVIDSAYELELSRGNTKSAEFIKMASKEDLQAFKYGAHGIRTESESVKKLMNMASKIQFAKLMQYTGISSIAEFATLIPEAGYKAVTQAITPELSKITKSLFLGGVTGQKFTNKMYDELSAITGVGLEELGFDSILSSSNMIATSRAGRYAERFVDNAAKATRRTTGHVEVIGRRLALNSIAINFGNVALGRDSIDNIVGGLSNRNLVELGLADLDRTGKAVPNTKFKKIVDNIRKHAKDVDGGNALSSGKPIGTFNIFDWDLESRKVFGDALTQQANHIMVNPDSTTARLWASSPVGAMFNQFRTFANNAASKVAGHNVNQAIQGLSMGSLAELSKSTQKVFWGAALGKLSLMLYGALNEAGRPDFEQRMEKYVQMDDFRDWTQALGRSSAITGLDSVVDTGLGIAGIDPLFNSSTVGRSRNNLDLMSTPTGQLVRDGIRTVEYTAQGKFDKAGKTAIKMSPIRRQLGINQFLNSMGID